MSGVGIRLTLVYVLLGLIVAGVAVAVVYLLFLRSSPKPWSPWKPTAVAVAPAAKQIALHVGERYLAPNGQTLAAVSYKDSKAIKAIFFPSGKHGQSVVDTTPADTASYFVCGPHAYCIVNDGAATSEQSYLLRQQALELALYSFRYLPAVTSVVVFIPPKQGNLQEQRYLAQVFLRSRVQDMLRRPLSDSVGTAPRPAPQRLTAADRTRISNLTGPSLYLWRSAKQVGGSYALQLALP